MTLKTGDQPILCEIITDFDHCQNCHVREMRLTHELRGELVSEKRRQATLPPQRHKGRIIVRLVLEKLQHIRYIYHDCVVVELLNRSNRALPDSWKL
jgi:hypothetical protein